MNTKKNIFMGILALLSFTSLGFQYYYTQLSGTGIINPTDPLSQYKYKSWDHYCKYNQIDCSALNKNVTQILSDGFIYDDQAYYVFNERFPYHSETEILSAHQKHIEKFASLLPEKFTPIDPKSISKILDWEGRFSMMNNQFTVVDSSYPYAGDNPIILTHYLFRNQQMLFLNNSTSGARMTADVDFVDPRTFEIIDEDFGYAKDRNRVYYYLNVVYDADPNTFQIHPKDNKFATDKNSVFYQANRIKNADKSTFTPLSGYFSKDKNKVYIQSVEVSKADSNTFIAISDYIGRDNYNAYAGKEKTNLITDLLSIKKLNQYYTFSSSSIFYGPFPIEDVDIVSFRAFNQPYDKFARDNVSLFKEGFKVDIEDIDSFEFIDDRFAKDNNNYYCLTFMPSINDKKPSSYPYQQKISDIRTSLDVNFTCPKPKQ